MKVLVCGGRNFDDRQLVNRTLDRVHALHPITHVIEGGAIGADRLGQYWANLKEIPLSTYHPDWKRHGRAAGTIRNKHMIEEGSPDVVVAFPGGAGTACMIKLAREAGILIIQP